MKLKKITSGLALLFLLAGTATVASCKGKDEPEQPNDDETPSDSTNTPSGFTQAEVDSKVNEQVLANAKSQAKDNLATYKTNVLSVAGIETTEDIDAAIAAGNKAIDAATTKDKVGEEYKKALAAVAEKVQDVIDLNAAADAEAAQTQAAILANAKTRAVQSVAALAAADNFYINAADDGSVANIVKVATEGVKAADSIANITAVVDAATKAAEETYVKLYEASFVEISTLEELVAIEEGKNYRLAKDIDATGYTKNAKHTYTGATLEASTSLSGVFDGAGHTISNWIVTDAADVTNKTGLLFEKVEAGSTVKDVRFLNCSNAGNAEGLAIITGQTLGATYSNIEFYGCNVNTGTKNYAGLVVGRNTKGSNTFDQITVKGNSAVVTTKYTGGLVGDAREVTTGDVITVSNIDMTVDLTVNDRSGGVIGRTDASKATFNFENIRLNITTLNNATNFSPLMDGNKNAYVDVTAKNVVISGSYGKCADLVIGRGNALKTENIYVVEDATEADSLKYTGATLVRSADLTADWYTNTLKLDAEAWGAEEDGSVKLKGATSNVIEEGAELLDIQVITTRVKDYYFYNEEFTAEDLIVMGTFRNSTGVEIQANIGTEESARLGKYVVTSTAFNKEAAGIYAIEVAAIKGETTVTKTYDVSVNLLSDIEVVTDLATVVFPQGTDLDSSDVIVMGVYSDGVNSKKLNIPAERFTVDSLNQYQKDTLGTYTITIDASEHGENFTTTYDVEVAPALTKATDAITVSVDGSVASNTFDTANNTATFKTINDALNYLEVIYAEDNAAVKTINLAAGVYNEKVYVNLDNVHFVGADSTRSHDVGVADNKFNKGYATQISFDCVNGKPSLDGLSTYGSDNSATVYVKADGFQATNISFVNTWDYRNTTQGDNQALALYIQGDQGIVTDCSLHGYQDTVQTKQGRHYFANCYIEGCTDFIYGVNSTTLLENCHVNVKLNDRNGSINESVICAPKTDIAYTYGYYFYNCKFTADQECTKAISLGRTWGADAQMVTINCNFASDLFRTNGFDSTNKCRYNNMSGSPVAARFKEYGNTGAGAISQAVDGMTMLTEAEATAMIDKANLFKADDTLGYAAWDLSTVTVDPIYAVTYVTDGSKVYPDVLGPNQTAVEATTTKDHYTFAGWFTDKACTTAYEFTQPVTSDLTLYAKFDLNTYGLSYVSEKGTAPAAVTEVSQLSEAHLPELVDEATNFTFGGWFYDEGFTQAAAKDQWLEEDTVLYAKWVDPSGSVQTNNYAFSYAAIDQEKLTEQTAGSKDKAYITQAVFDDTVNSFLTVIDSTKVQYRTSNNCIETKGESLSVTFEGTGTLRVMFSSTGGSNESWFSLEDSTGTALEASNASSLTVATGETNVYTVTGTTMTEVTYNITAAGTYVLCSNHSSRGCRLGVVEMVDNVVVAATEHTSAFSYAAIDQEKLTEQTAGSKDKAYITQAVFDDTVNSFLTVIDSTKVQYRTSNNCIETKGESLSVTFTGTGTLRVMFASTGGSNESWFSLEDSTGTALEASNASGLTVATGETNVYTVTGTTMTEVTYNITAAGTYVLCSNHSSRGCRLSVVEMVDIY